MNICSVTLEQLTQFPNITKETIKTKKEKKKIICVAEKRAIAERNR